MMWHTVATQCSRGNWGGTSLLILVLSLHLLTLSSLFSVHRAGGLQQKGKFTPRASRPEASAASVPAGGRAVCGGERTGGRAVIGWMGGIDGERVGWRR